MSSWTHSGLQEALVSSPKEIAAPWVFLSGICVCVCVCGGGGGRSGVSADGNAGDGVVGSV